MQSTFACGVFTSWWKNKDSNVVILHFAINRFVGSDLVHYNLPSNNTDKNHKKRVSLYIELNILKGDMETPDLDTIVFKDDRFNNLIYKTAEYILEISYTTKTSEINKREKGNVFVECHYFPMLSDSIVNISNSGTHLWTENSSNTKRISIEEGVRILSDNIVKVPEHIKARTTALVI